MDAYDRLAVGLPERMPPEGARRVSAKSLREAVAHVPLANPPQALSELERILDDMLAVAWRGADRAGVLGTLHGPVQSLCDGIAQHLGAESYPLPTASAERVAAAQRLEWKLACNDALALHELCAPVGKVPIFKTKLVAGLAVAGLVHASRALTWSYRQYRAPEPGVWQRLHALYGFATQAGVARQASAETREAAEPTTPHSTYLAALLLAAANPYRFSTRELQHAIDVIDVVADQCELAAGANAGIRVDVDADAGPDAATEEPAAGGSSAAMLDVEPVVRAFDERIAGLPEGATEVELAGSDGGRVVARTWFLRRLASGWARAARGDARLPAGHELDLVVGMYALHHALAGDVDFATFLRRVRGDAITVGQHELASAWMVAGDTAVPEPLRGKVLDQSLAGYRLEIGVEDGARLRIGELVGLAPAADAGDERDWMVGVIRWLRIEATRVLLGVELLHRTARAAGLRVVGRDGEARVPQRAVELPGADATGGLSLLLTNPLGPEVHAVEVLLPPLASDWSGTGGVGEWRPGGAEMLASTCVRVTLLPMVTSNTEAAEA